MKRGGAGLFFYPLLFVSLLLVFPDPPRADDLIDTLKSLGRMLKTPDRKKQKAAASSAELVGTWRIDAAGYAGRLVLEKTDAGFKGRVWFDAHQVWEELHDVRLEGATLSFLRPGPNQHYTGILSGNEARGTFDGSAPWSMVRSTQSPAQDVANRNNMDWLGREWRVREFASDGSYCDGVWTRLGASARFSGEWQCSWGARVTDTLRVQPVDGDQVTVTRESLGENYRGTLSRDGNSITGTTWGPGSRWTARIHQTADRPVPAEARAVTGEWRWTCCRGGHQGTFIITEHTPDGKIHGHFGDSPADNATPFEGAIVDGRIQFTRHLRIDDRPETQYWQAGLHASGDLLETVDGRWSGFAAGSDNTDFQARRVGGGLTKPTAPRQDAAVTPPKQAIPTAESQPIIAPVAALDPGKPLNPQAEPLQLGANESFQSLAGVGDMADAALMAEGMKLLLGEAQSTVTVARRAAPYYLYPSPAVRDQLAKLRPVWVESVGLKGAIAASASAFDAAWEEVTVAAALESEQGTRAALALAAQHKAELDALQARLVEVAKAAKQQGEPQDPLVELKRLRGEHARQMAATHKALTGRPLAASGGQGVYRLVDVKNGRGDEYVQVSRHGETIKSAKVVRDPSQPHHVKECELTAPMVIRPEAPTTVQVKLTLITNPKAFYMHFGESLNCVLALKYGAGNPPWHDWRLAKTWAVDPFLDDKRGRDIKTLRHAQESGTFSLPNRQRLLLDIANKRRPSWTVPLKDQEAIRKVGSDKNELLPAEVPTKEYDLIALYDHRNAADMKVLAEDSKRAYIQLSGSEFNTVLTYEWSDDGAAAEEVSGDPTDAEKRQRIAEIDANVAIIRHNVRRDREDLARESNPGRRVLLEFRILHGESDALAEQDLKQSLLTGQHVHTRSPFDEHVRGQFIENIRRDQMRMEEFQRGSASLQRLAALLPADDADQARAFIARQVGAADIARLDVAKLRRVADILFNQVQAKAQLDAARGEEEAAQVGLDMAMRAKAAADGGMMMTSLVAGPWLNVAYQGATGAWDGGFVEGINRAASTYSMPTFLAAQAYQGYQAGGWRGAAENVAISYVTGKAIQYGLTKSITAASRLFKPTSQEAFDLARHRQARERGESLVKDFQRTETEVIRLRAALSRGESGAEAKLRQLLQTREAKAAVIHENMHAKSFLKYKGDYHTQKVFNDDLGQIHERVQQRFHENMQGKGWMRTPLKEFRNASSAGTVGLDYDIGMDEKAVGALMKFGKPATLHDWQKDAQVVWNQSYKTVTGRGAQRSWETVTTSIHPEAYKDVALLSGNPAAVSKLWAQQSADVTRYKNWHMMNDPGMQIYEKLQEISRGSAKDMATKMLPLLGKAANAGGPGAQAMRQTNQHWRKVYGILDKFGKGDMDPVTASRQIRELTGGKSIAEVTEDMAALFEGLAKRSGSATH